MRSKIIRIFETVGIPFIWLWSVIVYEHRKDSIVSLKKLEDRDLLLNDVINQAIIGLAGSDPPVRGKIWVQPSDYSYEWVPKNKQAKAHGKITFYRKIEYATSNSAVACIAFVSGSRKIQDGELTSRKFRRIFGLLVQLIGLLSKLGK